MALLRRRALQALIDDGLLSSAQLKGLIGRLNRPVRGLLDAEWELIMLSALSHVGIVEYEPRFAGTAKLDVRFTHSSGLVFVGDVTCISDDDATRRNPVSQLVNEVSRRLDEARIEGGFTVSIEADSNRSGRGVKSEVILALPPPHQFSQYIFDHEFQAFLDRIRNEPNAAPTYSVNNEKASLGSSITLTEAKPPSRT